MDQSTRAKRAGTVTQVGSMWGPVLARCTVRYSVSSACVPSINGCQLVGWMDFSIISTLLRIRSTEQQIMLPWIQSRHMPTWLGSMSIQVFPSCLLFIIQLLRDSLASGSMTLSNLCWGLPGLSGWRGASAWRNKAFFLSQLSCRWLTLLLTMDSAASSREDQRLHWRRSSGQLLML